MHQHTNRLVHETSPYLLQHAHNPVDWYPWGDEAFEKARNEDKPVLVSIGYSACHWCHVMERESFENEATAQFMNQHFINIKIDREERPDIDHIYMDAVQAMTGSGGWPLNVFLLPDGRPFYGGTYFPPVRAFNRGSWIDTLQAVQQAYIEKRDELETQAANLTEHIQKSSSFGVGEVTQQAVFDRAYLHQVAQNMLQAADTEWGGFGRAPKFPQTFTINFLLRHHHFTGSQPALQQALLSLDKMIYGGIYDQLGGGFARYSTDARWLAPHFEKMLYDNALLVSTLAEAFQLTQHARYAQTIHHTLAFTRRELTSAEGGFYSALDADSEGVEGKFYTWSKTEIDEVLGADSEVYCRYYNVLPEGNWEDTNILWVPQPLEQFIQQQPGEYKGLQTAEAYQHFFDMCNARLMEHRSHRVRPGLDDKILLGWNALMNIAFSKAYAATGHTSYREVAIANMAFLESRFFDAGQQVWYHTYKNQVAKYPAFLEDYAYLAQAYIHLQEITGNQQYLLKAKETVELVLRYFAGTDDAFFYFTADFQIDVIVRKKEVYDGATPAGNSVMTQNLLYLSRVFDLAEWHTMATNMLQHLQKAVIQYPTSFGNWAMAVQQVVEPPAELALTGTNAASHLPALLKHYMPNRILQTAEMPSSAFPLLNGKEVQSTTLFYLCKNYACQAPVHSVEELLQLLSD